MNKKNIKILVIDDDTRLRSLLAEYLNSEGYSVNTVKDAKEGKVEIEKASYDLLIVDMMMPGKNGLEFTKELRENSNQPVLMLTAMGEVGDRIKGFESGVDDYLAKPFEPRELVLRIESILKRAVPGPEKSNIVKFGDYVFNTETGDLQKDGEFIMLTSRELKLLEIFANKLDQPISRNDIAKQLLGISERSVDVQVTRLRKKIEPDPKNPFYIQSAWGSGYILRSRQA